jgi:RNA polymerase sigma-70 factor (ECF subfamily)
VKEAARRETFDGPTSTVGQVLAFPDRGIASDDATLVQMLREGNTRAPRAAWQRLAPMVHRMLRRAFGPARDTDDLVQDVFLLLFQRVSTLREPQALRAFVIGITAHTIRRELRRMRLTRWLTFGDTPLTEHSGVDYDSREAVRRLYAILDRLGPDDRTAFTLRFLEGVDVMEVAAALGMSLTTTKRRLAHARDRVVFHARRDATLVGYLAAMGARGAEADA